MYQLHVDGTRLLCKAAVAAGVRRMVLSSTSGTIAVAKRADRAIDETLPAPVELIGRWPYYASKLYQEETARRACGDAIELVILNPSLLLGPGDDRLSSTRLVMQFLGREIAMTPPGGLNFVDVRDVASGVRERDGTGQAWRALPARRHELDLRGILRPARAHDQGAGAPRPRPRPRHAVGGPRPGGPLPRPGKTVPIEPLSVDMAEHHWFFDSGKAARDLGFVARDATETLHDTVRYLRENFLGKRDILVSAS